MSNGYVNNFETGKIQVNSLNTGKLLYLKVIEYQNQRWSLCILDVGRDCGTHELKKRRKDFTSLTMRTPKI